MKQKHKNASKKVTDRSEPTPSELANLAVMLSQKDGWGTSSETLVKNALDFWLDARQLLAKWRANPESIFPKPAPQPPRAPEPKRYPVKLDEFLALMLPHLSGRSGDKYNLFREYLRFRLRNPSPPAKTWAHGSVPPGAVDFDCCHPRIVPKIENMFSYSAQGQSQKPEPTKDDVDRYFAIWRTQGIPDRSSFHYHARYFRAWYQTKHAAETSTSKADNAFKRYAKARLRKHLWEKTREANPKSRVALKGFPKVTDEQWTELVELNSRKSLRNYKNWDYDIAGTAKNLRNFS